MYQSYMPDSTMYSLFKLLRFDKNEVDLSRMAKAIEMAIKNHPALRTVLQYNEDGELIQKYDPKISVAVTPEKISEEELIQRYEKQLKLYRLAVEKNYGMPVKKCLIWSFWLSKEIEI